MKQYDNLAILIIDDEPKALQTFVDHFGDEWNILTATSGKEALEKLRSRKNEIAVVVVDQRMPEMTGLELMDQIKKEFPLIVRVLFTGYSDAEVVRTIVNEAGIFKCIYKPYKEEEVQKILKESIEKYLDKKDKAKELSGTLRFVTRRTAHSMARYTVWATHQLNNALTPVKVFMDLAHKDWGKNKMQKEFAVTAMEQMNKTISILHHLMDIYTYRAYTFEKTPLKKLLEFEDDKINRMIKEKKIVVKKDILEPELEMVADIQSIRESIRRLVENAVEASKDGGAVEIAAGKCLNDGEEAVMFQVKDYGCGMTWDEKQDLFVPYMKPKNKTEIKGLGLAFVHATIARHGGDIDVSSRPDEGTTVSFALPLIAGEDQYSREMREAKRMVEEMYEAKKKEREQKGKSA